MEPVVLLVASGPRTPEAATALALAAALQEAGHPVSLCLLEDATLLALARSDRPLPAPTRVYAAADDLRLRGFTVDDVTPGVQVTDHGALVDLITMDGVRTIGVL